MKIILSKMRANFFNQSFSTGFSLYIHRVSYLEETIKLLNKLKVNKQTKKHNYPISKRKGGNKKSTSHILKGEMPEICKHIT